MKKGKFYIIDVGYKAIAKIIKKPTGTTGLDFIYAKTLSLDTKKKCRVSEGGYFRYRFVEGIKLSPQVS